MNALVTGGGGFLGKAIVRRLLERGDTVRSFSRKSHPELTKLGVEQFAGYLHDQSAVEKAIAGSDIVFHVAAKAGVWGPRQEYWQTNVVGSENVIVACRKQKVSRLVYTSSPSVVFTGADEIGINESTPYSRRFLAWYPETKAVAEQSVLSANSSTLATVALRPHLIWGPGDNHLIPRLVDRAGSGKLRRIGPGTNRVDATYIDNAADAHILAADRLTPGAPIAGKAYFISNGEPVNLWDFINRILKIHGVAPVTRSVPADVAYFAGWILESTHKLFRLQGEPRMTRFVARQLSTSHWFDLSAARRDLSYEPKVTIDEGLTILQSDSKSE